MIEIATLPDPSDVLSRLRAVAAGDGNRAGRARQAAEHLRLARGFHWVGFYDVTPSEICIVAWTGSAGPAFPRFPRTQGLNGAAVAERRPIIVNDVRKDPRYLTTFGSTLAEAVVPVLRDDTIVGTIDVESDRVDAFEPADERFLQQCAVALAPLWSSSAA